MPTPRQRNSRDDKSRPTKGQKAPQTDRKRTFKTEATRSSDDFNRTDKKSFAKGERGSYGNSRATSSERKPYGKERSSDIKRTFSDRDKKPFRSDEKSTYQSDNADKRGGTGFKKERFGDAPRTFGDREKKPFRSGEKRPYKPDTNDAKARSGSKKERFGDASKSFGDRDKKPFRSGESKPYRSDFSDAEGRTSFKKDKFSSERPYKKTLSPRKTGAEKLGGKGRKNPLPSQNNDGLIRLNRYISNAGICSRRKADELIAAGVVSVNGEIVSELGFRVNPAKDVIRYNGETLKREKMVYVLLNKPKDYITTTDDPQERRTVMQLVEKASKERIYPVGRLDRNTTGLLLMTNDGDLADKLSHPKNNVTKIYHAELSRSLTQGDLNKIAFGLELEDGFIKPDEITYVQGGTKREVGIQIHSGKNRIVRRIFEHLGYDVVKLDRVIYANLTKKDLPRGRWRHLDEKEIIQLKHLIK